jgi:enoyl-CoA hydratase/carnithine racemase
VSALPGDVASRSREPLDSAALFEALHSPGAGVSYSPLGSTPWVYLDLDALASLHARQRKRALPWLRGRACPVIGLRGDSLRGDSPRDRPRGNPLAAACDLVVACDGEAQALIDRIERAPLAAMTLVQVLRATEMVPITQGLLIESMAFATLQAGPEFRAWLAARERVRSPGAAGRASGAPLRIVRAGSVLEIALARPERRNALSVELRDALVEALDLAVADPSIESVAIAGDGPDFCAGGDLAEFGTAPDPATAHAVRSARSPAAAVVACRDRVDFRLHGACVGAGAELAAFGRRVIAGADTWFQLPELGFGLIPGAGGCVSLVRRIGRQRTAWLAVSGERIDAATALAWGLVDTVE